MTSEELTSLYETYKQAYLAHKYREEDIPPLTYQQFEDLYYVKMFKWNNKLNFFVQSIPLTITDIYYGLLPEIAKYKLDRWINDT